MVKLRFLLVLDSLSSFLVSLNMFELVLDVGVRFSLVLHGLSSFSVDSRWLELVLCWCSVPSSSSWFPFCFGLFELVFLGFQLFELVFFQL